MTHEEDDVAVLATAALGVVPYERERRDGVKRRQVELKGIEGGD